MKEENLKKKLIHAYICRTMACGLASIPPDTGRHRKPEVQPTNRVRTLWLIVIFGESHEDVLCPHRDRPDAVEFRRTCAVSSVLGAGRSDRADPRWSDFPPQITTCERAPTGDHSVVAGGSLFHSVVARGD